MAGERIDFSKVALPFFGGLPHIGGIGFRPNVLALPSKDVGA
jgi:hypothetical protein